MKKIVLIVILLSSFGLGQNFFESDQQEEYNETSEQSSFYSNSEEPQYEEPDQGVDSMGNPADVPIDEKWVFLVLSGTLVGFYFLRKKSKLAS